MVDTRPDSELVIRTKAGDDEAFRVLVERHLRTAYDFALRYVTNRDEADDIVQEAFVKTWKAIGRYDPTKRFRTWLITIVRHTALDALKKRRDPVISAFDDGEGGNVLLETFEDDTPLADTLFDRALDAATLDAALTRLSPDRRAAVVLHERDGLTFEEIATVLGKPMNTVKSWYRRSLMVLRGFLEEGAPKKP